MYNQVTIAGRITSALELKHTTNGTPVLNFSIAINERRGDTEHVLFVDVTAWNNTAENTAKFMGKGAPVLIGGRLSQEKWDDDGKTRSKVFVMAERVVFLESSSKSEQATATAATSAKPARKNGGKKEKAD